jgi:hypothetical protein
MYTGEPFLPGGEDKEEEETDNDHSDESGGVIVGFTVTLKTEWEQEEDKSCHENESTDD